MKNKSNLKMLAVLKLLPVLIFCGFLISNFEIQSFASGIPFENEKVRKSEKSDNQKIETQTNYGSFTSTQTLQMPNLQSYSHFGYSVAIDGDYAVVGAPREDINGENYQGAAYVFKRSGYTWNLQQKLTGSISGGKDMFGHSVAIYQNRIVVGTPQFSWVPPRVYVFKRDANDVWNQEAELVPQIGTASFGWSVAIYGNYIIAGAYTNGNRVHIFKFNGLNWVENASITPPANSIPGGKFGASVDIYGDTAVIGNPTEFITDGNEGAIYIYSRNGENWNLQQKITAFDKQEEDYFGWDVALEGKRIVAGNFVYNWDSTSNKQGGVYVYERNNNVWFFKNKLQTQKGYLNDFFGSLVNLQGNCVVAGAPHYRAPTNESGKVYLFRYAQYNATWYESYDWEHPQYNAFSAGLFYGGGVDMDGGTVIVGAPNDYLGTVQNPSGSGYGSAKILSYPLRGCPKKIPSNYQPPYLIPKFRIILDLDWTPDLALFNEGVFHLLSTENGVSEIEFGSTSDIPVPADYDGDGITDIAVFRDGRWLINQSAEGYREVIHGQRGDVPVPGYFDSDALADFAVFRSGTWHLMQSRDGYRTIGLGMENDKPFAADLDGDKLYDPAVFRDGTWFWISSLSGAIRELRLGNRGDIPLIEDFDGDFVADFAVFNRGVWQIQQSLEGYKTFEFGAAGDIPLASDYDVDGKADAAVFRNGTWLMNQSSAGLAEIEFGQAGDVPLPIR